MPSAPETGFLLPATLLSSPGFLLLAVTPHTQRPLARLPPKQRQLLWSPCWNRN